MKHIKLYEQFVNERYVTKRDIEGWEKDNGKLPFPSEVLAASKKIASYGLANDDQLTRAYLWILFNEGNWMNMEKFGAHIKQFYGSDFYSTFSSGYDSLFMQSKYYAAEVISHIEDKVANEEEIEPAYYEVKEYFNSFGLNYNRNRVFDSAVKHVEEWIKKHI
jgi:hypothetical protein